MTIDEVKEKILSVNRTPGLTVECDICNIIGEIQTGNIAVICDVTKKDLKKKRAEITHWHYSFTNGRMDEFNFISSTQKRLK